MAKHLICKNSLLREFKRTRQGGAAKFTFPLSKQVTRGLDWPELPERTKGWTPEAAELAATLVELTPNNSELASKATSFAATWLGDFQIIRKRKKSGKDSAKSAEMITEVLCSITFEDPLGCAKLEQYMLSAARSEMRITYNPEAVQETLPGAGDATDKDQMQLGEEQREATSEIPDGVPSEDEESQPEKARGRGRPRKSAATA